MAVAVNEISDDVLEALPPVLAEIAQAAGLRAALQLAAGLGGTLVYVGKSPGEKSLLVKTVGPEAARQIAGLYGGEQVEIPLGPAGRRREQRAAIQRMLDSGLPVQEIARRIGVHAKTVRRQKTKTARERQPDLFDH